MCRCGPPKWMNHGVSLKSINVDYQDPTVISTVVFLGLKGKLWEYKSFSWLFDLIFWPKGVSDISSSWVICWSSYQSCTKSIGHIMSKIHCVWLSCNNAKSVAKMSYWSGRTGTQNICTIVHVMYSLNKKDDDTLTDSPWCRLNL